MIKQTLPTRNGNHGFRVTRGPHSNCFVCRVLPPALGA